MLPVLTRRNMPRWSDPLTTLDRDFDEMVDRLFNPQWWGGQATYPVDIHEDADNIYVEAELPGFRRDDIEVNLENGVLSIRAQRKPRESSEQHHARLHERRATQYARWFQLPSTVDDQNVSARYEDGVLYLTLPKKAEAKARQIKVR